MKRRDALLFASLAAVALSVALRPGVLGALGVVGGVWALEAWWRARSLRESLVVAYLVALAPASVVMGAYAPVSPAVALLGTLIVAGSFLVVGWMAWGTRRRPAALAWWVGVSWTAVEFAWRVPASWGSWGLPFMTLGSVWVEGAAREVFAWGGPRGATVLLWLVAGLVFTAWRWHARGRWLAGVVLGLAVWLAVPSDGGWIDGPRVDGSEVAASGMGGGGRTVLPVRIVQHAPTPVEMAAARFDPVAEGFHQDVLRFRSEGAGVEGRLVVWPEASLPRPWRVGSDTPAWFPRDSDVLLGAAFERHGEVGNGALLWRDGMLSVVQEKRRLVPWVERDVARGTVQPPFSWGGVKVAPVLCFEALFPGFMRQLAQADADVLVVLANDAYAGGSTVPGLHVRAARMRAVESGLPVVFVQATGPSAVVDAWGRVVASTRHGLVASLDVDVPLVERVTPFRRWGDGVGVTAFAWWVLGIVARGLGLGVGRGLKGGEADGVVIG